MANTLSPAKKRKKVPYCDTLKSSINRLLYKYISQAKVNFSKRRNIIMVDIYTFFPLLSSLLGSIRGLQRDVVYLGWPIAPSYMSPNAGGWGELRGVSQWVHLYTRAQISFGDLTPYLTFVDHTRYSRGRVAGLGPIHTLTFRPKVWYSFLLLFHGTCGTQYIYAY